MFLPASSAWYQKEANGQKWQGQMLWSPSVRALDVSFAIQWQCSRMESWKSNFGQIIWSLRFTRSSCKICSTKKLGHNWIRWYASKNILYPNFEYILLNFSWNVFRNNLIQQFNFTIYFCNIFRFVFSTITLLSVWQHSKHIVIMLDALLYIQPNHLFLRLQMIWPSNYGIGTRLGLVSKPLKAILIM